MFSSFAFARKVKWSTMASCTSSIFRSPVPCLCWNVLVTVSGRSQHTCPLLRQMQLFLMMLSASRGLMWGEKMCTEARLDSFPESEIKHSVWLCTSTWPYKFRACFCQCVSSLMLAQCSFKWAHWNYSIAWLNGFWKCPKGNIKSFHLRYEGTEYSKRKVIYWKMGKGKKKKKDAQVWGWIWCVCGVQGWVAIDYF